MVTLLAKVVSTTSLSLALCLQRMCQRFSTWESLKGGGDNPPRNRQTTCPLRDVKQKEQSLFFPTTAAMYCPGRCEVSACFTLWKGNGRCDRDDTVIDRDDYLRFFCGKGKIHGFVVYYVSKKSICGELRNPSTTYTLFSGSCLLKTTTPLS